MSIGICILPCIKMPWFSCFKIDLYDAVAIVLDYQDTPFIKRIVIHMLRHYANDISNPLERDLVDTIERLIL